MTVGTSASKTRRDLGIRRPGCRWRADATARCAGWNPESSSVSPQSSGACRAAHDAPGPHASTSTAFSEWLRWSVAGPSGVSVARHASWPRTLWLGPEPKAVRVRPRLSGFEGRKRALTSGASAAIQRELQVESASPSRLGLNCQVTIMHARNFARKPQPEARSRGVCCRLALDATETFEEPRLVLAGDADAIVDHRQRRLSAVGLDPYQDSSPGR